MGRLQKVLTTAQRDRATGAVVGMAVGVGAATLIGIDGESNWLEGVMLLGVYAILAVAFFYIP